MSQRSSMQSVDYPDVEADRLPKNDSRSAEEGEIELGALWNGIRRYLAYILITSLLIGGAIFIWSQRQPNVFEASSSLVTNGSGGNIGTLRDNVITASPLPQGALAEALKGPTVLGEVIALIRKSTKFPESERTEIAAKLQQELGRGQINTITLQDQLDFNGNGIYNVTARAGTPEMAAFLADGTAQALLNWDRNRALSGVRRAERSLTAQLSEIERQLKAGDQTDLERQTLIASRASLQRSVAQASIQAEGVSGSLELVAPAVLPLDRVAPKPTRNAILAALLTLLLGFGLAALRTVTDRTARTEDDLLTFGLPTLGMIPRLRRREVVFNGIVRAARQAGLYEAIGFLRVNILSRIGTRPGQRIMISSTAPGEGKSSLTATLSDGLAASGQRVLIIDADMRRGTQQEVWDKYENEHNWIQLTGQKGARNLQEALANPDNVQVMEAEPGVHVLPAGPGMHDSLGLLNRAPLGEYLTRWGQGYDLILIDSPPLLAIADGLVIGRHVDHVLLVVEEGRTSLQAVRQSLRRARNANVNVLGFILNKVNPSNQENRAYGYSYAYAPNARKE